MKLSIAKEKKKDDKYVLFKNVQLNDILIKKIEEGYRELYRVRTKFLRYAYVGL